MMGCMFVDIDSREIKFRLNYDHMTFNVYQSMKHLFVVDTIDKDVLVSPNVECFGVEELSYDYEFIG